MGLTKSLKCAIIIANQCETEKNRKTPKKEKKMTRYNQGWRRNQQEGLELDAGLKARTVAYVALLCVIILITLLGTFGCAGANSSRLATELPLETSKVSEVGMPASVSLNIRVAQMGLDCQSQTRVMRLAVEQMLEGEGIAKPSIFQLEPLAGSSLCGLAQGMAELVRMPELGARNKAKARLTIYWPAITEADLRRAHTALQRMRAKTRAK